MSKYAVYLIVVEDTEENDLNVFDCTPAETIERVAGNLDWDEARTLTIDAQRDYGNTEYAK